MALWTRLLTVPTGTSSTDAAEAAVRSAKYTAIRVSRWLCRNPSSTVPRTTRSST